MYLGIGNSVPISKGGHVPPDPGFEYDPIAWCEDDGPNIPTVTGTPGGVFSASPSISGFNTATGAIPANTAAGSYAITYTVNGVSETDTITISSDVSTSFTYPSTVENRFTVSPTQAVATAGTYSFTVNPGNITFANGAATSTTGEINLTGAALGSYTVQFQPNSSCGNPTTASFTVVQAFQSFEFTIQTSSPNETFTIPTTGSGYSYHVDWGTGTAGQNNFVGPYTGNVTSPVYNSAGTHTIKIGLTSDTFPRIMFNNTGDKLKIRNITQWGETAWTDFSNGFAGCENLQLTATDSPNLTSCTNLSYMFNGCINFTGNSSIDNWNVSTITNLTGTFRNAYNFNQDLNSWDVSNVRQFGLLFYSQHQNGSFNGNISNWNMSSCTGTDNMFYKQVNFNQDVSAWSFSNSWTNASYMFYSNSSFNQNLGSWNVSGVLTMDGMLRSCTNFNNNGGTLSAWNVSSVTTMQRMFQSSTSFIGTGLDSWNPSSCLDMSLMFFGVSSFNQNIGSWDVSRVENFSNIFMSASSFNQDISSWNTSSAIDMSYMFGATSFNQAIPTVGNQWNVSNVTNMAGMFYNTTSFDQDISSWDINQVTNFDSFMLNVNLSTTNYDALLTAWDGQGAMAYSGTVNFGDSVPSCDNAASNGGFAARASLITKWGGITDKFSQNNTCQPLAGFDYTSDEYCANASPSTVNPTITGTLSSLSYITESYSVVQTFSGLNGQTNTGGGGGGGASRLSSSSSTSSNGGSGGSGIVILKYPTNLNATFSAGLTKTDAVSGSNTITSITAGSGTVTFANAGTLSEYLIVAGGGGGGGSSYFANMWQSSGGGGGAGGLLTATNLSISAQSYNITIGEGGSGGSGTVNSGSDRAAGQKGTNGQNSIFSSFTAIGGGGGGGGVQGTAASDAASRSGLNGGSGGGVGGREGGNANGSFGTGTAGQGNDGGSTGSGRSANGGGGAGAAGVGGAVNNQPGRAGGIGVISNITSTATYYAGGGGGGGYYQPNAIGNGTGGNGGTGGGGAGGTSKP
jgi:surface protein